MATATPARRGAGVATGQALTDPTALWDEVYRYAYSILGNRQDAEDAAQEVYATLCRQRPPYVTRSWLMGCARCRSFDILRRRSARPPAVPLDSRLPVPGDLASDALDREQARVDLAGVLPLLARIPHGPLVLAQARGDTPGELVAREGCRWRLVTLRMNRARRQLRLVTRGGMDEYHRAKAERQRRYRARQRLAVVA